VSPEEVSKDPEREAIALYVTVNGADYNITKYRSKTAGDEAMRTVRILKASRARFKILENGHIVALVDYDASTTVLEQFGFSVNLAVQALIY
jgi:hypothetical protein